MEVIISEALHIAAMGDDSWKVEEGVYNVWSIRREIYT